MHCQCVGVVGKRSRCVSVLVMRETLAGVCGGVGGREGR